MGVWSRKPSEEDWSSNFYSCSLKNPVCFSSRGLHNVVCFIKHFYLYVQEVFVISAEEEEDVFCWGRLVAAGIEML